MAELAKYTPVEAEKLFAKEMRFDAGARIAGEGPFYELIWFSDCEGVINSEISKKLYQDFLDFDKKAAKVEDDWFKSIYLQFKEAFRLASNNGFVKFH